MDVECSVPPRLSEEDYAREIILAAYHRDAARVASVLRLCGPKATAEMSLSRAAAVQLLGEDVYLGSHSWSTQEGFPVMYFAGERTRASRSSAPFPARISPPFFLEQKCQNVNFWQVFEFIGTQSNGFGGQGSSGPPGFPWVPLGVSQGPPQGTQGIPWGPLGSLGPLLGGALKGRLHWFDRFPLPQSK